MREITPGCVSTRSAHSTTDDLFRSLSEERSDETKCRSRSHVRFDSLRSLNDRDDTSERDVSRETAVLPRNTERGAHEGDDSGSRLDSLRSLNDRG